MHVESKSLKSVDSVKKNPLTKQKRIKSPIRINLNSPIPALMRFINWLKMNIIVVVRIEDSKSGMDAHTNVRKTGHTLASCCTSYQLKAHSTFKLLCNQPVRKFTGSIEFIRPRSADYCRINFKQPPKPSSPHRLIMFIYRRFCSIHRCQKMHRNQYRW